ncbi:MAG: class III extradiol ring-cleavage dioxygenase [Pseudomonadota bacterium]
MSKIASLFISHGSPDIALADTAASEFLRRYAQDLPRPEAIVVVSAHFEAGGVAVTGDAKPQTIHDFGGFSDELYKIRYEAPGCPALAGRIACMMQEAGLAAGVVQNRGFDHGTWVPLSLMYPQADIPVVQVSVDPHAGPVHHFKIGRSLEPLRNENILVIGSGSMTHNLKEALAALRDGERCAAVPPWVAKFAQWMEKRIASSDTEALLAYRQRAPYAVDNHPTEEHLLPLFSAVGAAGDSWNGSKIHASMDFGVLAMDAYAFN